MPAVPGPTSMPPAAPVRSSRYDRRVMRAPRPLAGLRRAAVLAAVALLLAACGSAPPVDTPSAVARAALDRLSAGDFDGVRALSCAGAEDRIREELGMPGDLSGDILPGIDVNAVLDAIKIDATRVAVSDETITGDTATVAVGGDLIVTFDPDLMRPLVMRLVETQGLSLTEEQVDALLATLGRAGRPVPMTQTLGFVREDGAWKLCTAD